MLLRVLRKLLRDVTEQKDFLLFQKDCIGGWFLNEQQYTILDLTSQNYIQYVELLILKENTEAIQRKKKASYLKMDNVKYEF